MSKCYYCKEPAEVSIKFKGVDNVPDSVRLACYPCADMVYFLVDSGEIWIREPEEL